MNKLLKAALDLQNYFKSQNWQFCVIGGLAIQRWGEPRVTRDVDISLLTRFKDEEGFIRAILSTFTSRIDDPVEFALNNRVLLVKTASGVPVDIALGGMPFEVEAVERASYYLFAEGASLLTASAEDLVIMKAFAARDKDWGDIRGILIRNNLLDWPYIERHLVPLADIKGEPEILTKLATLRRALVGGPS